MRRTSPPLLAFTLIYLTGYSDLAFDTHFYYWRHDEKGLRTRGRLCPSGTRALQSDQQQNCVMHRGGTQHPCPLLAIYNTCPFGVQFG